MSINVTGPDGRVHSFPDGTAAADIDRAMRQRYAPSPALRQAQASAARSADERRGVRSLWERFGDRFQDSTQNSYGALARFLVGRGIQGSYDSRDPETGQVLQRRHDNTTAVRQAVASQETQRRSDLAARTRGDEWYRAEGGTVGRAAAGLATLSGELAGAAADPTSWIAWGRTAVARAVTSAGMGATSDAVAQGSDLSIGAAERWDAGRTALAAAASGAFSIIGDAAPSTAQWVRQRIFRRPESAAAADLQVGDDLYAPPLTTREVSQTPNGLQKPQEGPLETPDGAGRIETAERPHAGSADSPESNRGIVSEEPTDGPTARPDADVRPQQGWEGVDWGKRGSPERAETAKAHLDDLKRWIKPEEVDAFVRALDEGLPDGEAASRINSRWVDWGDLDDPREVLKFTAAMGDIFRDAYSAAGDARRGWEATAETARHLGVSLSDVIKTHADITGEGGIAARSGALRDAALASDRAFYDQLVSTRAAMARGDLTGVPTLVEALNRTVVLGAMDSGVSAEIARALQYRQRKADFAQTDLQSAMTELGRILNHSEELDASALNKVMDGLADAYEKGGSAGLRQRVAQMREMGFWDYAGYAFTANLLSAPTTHIRNAIGTPIHALFQIGERYIAAGIGSVRRAAGMGSRERVTFREANAYFSGLLQSWAEPLALARSAFVRGAPVADLRSSVMGGEAVSSVPFAFSSERAAAWASNPLSPKSWADFGGVILFETMRTLGFRPSVAVDELNKALGRRMQLNALAYREADYRAALASPEDADRVFSDTLAALQEEPTAAAFREAREFFVGDQRGAQGVYAPGSREEEMALMMQAIDHRQMALDHARLLTFQDSGPIVEKIDTALKAVPLVKHLFVNFVRTPVALLKAGLVSRNPVVGGAVSALELTTRAGREKHKALFDAVASEEQALARGGAEADLVLARQVMGAAVLSTLWLYWAGGNVVGKQTPEERRSGVQDYSFRLPDGTWVQYSGMSPVAEMLGLVADVGQAIREHDVDDDGVMALMGALAAAVRNNVVNKSFLAGVSDFMEMMTGGSYGASSDEASGEAVSRKIGEAVAPRVVPAGSLLRRAAQDIDPVVRDVRSFKDMILAGVPTMSQSLAARRDFLGRPMVRPEGQRGVFQAFNTSEPADDPLERELADLALAMPEGFRIGMSPRKMNGQDLTTEEYSRLIETQGQLYRDPATGRNMEEALRHLITTEEYLGSPPEARAYDVTQLISRYRTRVNAAVRNPRSPLFMREAARRTGEVRLQEETRRRGWSRSQALKRSLDYGLDPNDPEIRQLHEALFPEAED